MSDENVQGGRFGATLTSVNGISKNSVWILGDNIGAPGRIYPDNPQGISELGCVKAGTNITIAEDGTISATGTLGSDWTNITNKPFNTLGSGLTVTNGVLSVTGGGGSVDWADITGKPATFPATPATATTLGGVKAGANITITSDGTISASGGPGGSTDWKDITNKPATFAPPIATESLLGGVKPGRGLNVSADGTLTADASAPSWNEVTGKPAVFPVAVATKSALGGVIAGAGVNIDGSGVISVSSAAPTWNDITGKPPTFTPPIASDKQLGGVKEGAGINIEADGTINTLQAAPCWNEVLDKPATFPVAIATDHSIGGVYAGPGVSITEGGEISVRTTPPAWDEITNKPDEYNPPVASVSVLGGVKQGNNISIDPDGTISAGAIDIPIASSFTLGGVKIGNGITIQEDGTIGTDATQPHWTDILDRPEAFPPTTAQEGVIGGIMPDDNFSVSPTGSLSAKPFVGKSFAIVAYDDDGKIGGSYTASLQNGNLTLGGSKPTTGGEEATYRGALSLVDLSGKYKSTIYNDSFDYDIALTNGPNIRTGFLPFVSNVVGELISLSFGSIVDAIGYATGKKLGVVQVGGNIDVDTKGVISVKTADKSNLGLMIAGANLNVDKGVVTPAIATTAAPGIVQVGRGLEVDASGVINTTEAVGFLNRVVFYNSTMNPKEFDWTLPTGAEYFRVTVVGGGGSGALANSDASKGPGGGGGGGGGYARAMFYGYKFDVGTVFKCGVGCTNFNGNGDGTQSYFRKSTDANAYLFCEGGKGGQIGDSPEALSQGFAKGGKGGRGDKGTFDSTYVFNAENAAGGSGSHGLSINTPKGWKTIGGNGGASILGNGGAGYVYTGPGSGAGGGGDTNGNLNGNAGNGGIVIIEW